MPSGVKTSPAKRAEVIKLRKQKKNYKDIADITGISIYTVTRICHAASELGEKQITTRPGMEPLWKQWDELHRRYGTCQK